LKSRSGRLRHVTMPILIEISPSTYGDIVTFRFLKCPPLPSWIFEFVKFNFIGWCSPEGQNAPLCQISSKSVNPLWRYCNFSIFQDGGRLPSWIWLGHIWTTHRDYLMVSVQNLVVINAVIVIIWTFQYLVHLAGKSLFTPQKVGFEAIWPLNWLQYQQKSKGTPLHHLSHQS